MATINNINNSKENSKINNHNKNITTNNKTKNKDNFDNYTTTKYTYSDIFKAASKKYNISQNLLEAVAYTESSFRANATSYCGAQGVMQLMPATANSLGVEDAYDPVQNIMGGAKYLSQLLKKYNGNTSLALAAYNGGPGNVAKHNGVPSFCKSYVNKVENLMNKGVNVPNTTITVNSLSKSGSLMSEYIDTDNNITLVSNTSSSVSKNKNINKQEISNISMNTTNNLSDNKPYSNKYRQFDQSQLTRILSKDDYNTNTEFTEERIDYLLTKLGINTKNSYDMVDILDSIKNYYV